MITLYYKDNVSDKVYQVNVEPSALNQGRYNVMFAYGRRGGAMHTGIKNSSPLTLEEANHIAAKLVQEKTLKGYVQGEDGVQYKDVDKEVSGYLPMLLTPVDEGQVYNYISEDWWAAQEKYDGRRMMIKKSHDADGPTVQAINRKGLFIGAPQVVLDEVAKLPSDFVLDGELVGETYYAFDMIISSMAFENRLSTLERILRGPRERVILAPTHFGDGVKAKFMHQLKIDGREGIVFKRNTEYYNAGRTPFAVKCKFVATANVCVTKINVQRSVSIETADHVACGNVSIPVNREIPKVGDIVEVRYLYAMPSNALYQPVYSRRRDDIHGGDDVSTLKYKREEED
jgi:bifunctional non-homologous end joining protein LigD